MKQEFLQLIRDLDPSFGVVGRLMSEKRDGMRAVWIPCTRGVRKADVGFANIDKDDRYVDVQYSTGLWSRYGNVIHAPDWWLDKLPDVPLDGELYSPSMKREEIMSIVKTLQGSSLWQDIGFYVTETVSYKWLLTPRPLPWPTREWPKVPEGVGMSQAGTFNTSIKMMDKFCEWSSVLHKVEQYLVESEFAMKDYFNRIVSRGGEGIVVREGQRYWTPERVPWIRRLKPVLYDNGIVTDVTMGKGKYAGMIGALILDSGLKLSGMDDHIRGMKPEEIIGKLVRYKYREKTLKGVPSEARFDGWM